MKKILSLFCLIFMTLNIKATHIMGGEITWECIKDPLSPDVGKYIFTMKLYRDCDGITLPTTQQTLNVWNHPSVTTINLLFISNTDISPDCNTTNSGNQPLDCSTNPAGAVQEYIYRSMPVTLIGTPPISNPPTPTSHGWHFTWDSCCRNASIINLASPSSDGFTLRASMFAFIDQFGNSTPNDPCFDSSPTFLESPKTIMCSGSPFTFTQNAYDSEMDSLVYNWDQPLDDFFGSFNPPTTPSPLVYRAPYSATNPLPGNPVLNSQNGQISYTSNIIGNFVTVVRVDAYRSNQLVSQVFREIQTSMIACPTINGSLNKPPSLLIQNQYLNVTAGDLVSINISANDSDFYANGVSQNISLEVKGYQMSNNNISPNNCNNPPCATFTTSFGNSPSFINGVFRWQTDSTHLINNINTDSSTTYIFTVKAYDDFCPANGVAISEIYIKVYKDISLGCTDSLANNYDSTANVDDGSCIYCNITNNIIILNPTTNTSCNGLIISNTISNSPIINYMWTTNNNVISNNNFIDSLCTGVYILVSKDSSNCTKTDTIALVTSQIYGCTDANAYNYNSFATVDDGTCQYCDLNISLFTSNSSSFNLCDGIALINSVTTSTPPVSYLWSNGSLSNNITSLCSGSYYLTVSDSVGCIVTDTFFIAIQNLLGCTDPSAINYNPRATIDDSSCISLIRGCTDISALNYDSIANFDDGSCCFVSGCTDPFSLNYDSVACYDNGSCIAIVFGCTDANAFNYFIGANVDDGSCCYQTGCTNPQATNYDSSACFDNQSCIYITSCTSPDITGLGVTNIIHNRATLTFDNMNTSSCRVDQLRIKYREVGTSSWNQKNMASPVGYDPLTGVCNSTIRTDKLLLGLSPNTIYEWQMRVWYCKTVPTGWVNGPNFTTLDNCPNVGNLTVSTPTSTKATFMWDDSNGAYSFVRLQGRVDTVGSGFFNIGGIGVPYGTYSKNKNGLVPGTKYRVKSRTWCDINGGAYKAPSWTSFIYFTMPGFNRFKVNDLRRDLDVYPNPSRDVFNISFNTEQKQDITLRIRNIVGEEIYTEDLKQHDGTYTKAISLENYPKAIYFLEIETIDGIINKKLILQ